MYQKNNKNCLMKIHNKIIMSPPKIRRNYIFFNKKEVK